VAANSNPEFRAVESFSIKVLGGTFHVSEVSLEVAASAAERIRILRELPEDRWFVMASDDDSDHLDSLAIIDDDMEFRIYARGHLEQD